MAKKDVNYTVPECLIKLGMEKFKKLSEDDQKKVITLMKKVNIGPCKQLLASFDKYVGTKWGNADIEELEIDNKFYDEWKKFYENKEVKDLSEKFYPFFGNWKNSKGQVTRKNKKGTTTLLNERDLCMLRNMIIHHRLELQAVIDNVN